MPKIIKQQVKAKKIRPLYSVAPWSFSHHPDRSEIIAHVEIAGRQEVIATAFHANGVDARAVTEFIVKIVNDYEKNTTQMSEAIEALELCLKSEGLTWEAEQAADITVRRAMQKA